jgi:phosphoglycolate phosphatase-like HAD superfamily hydrolase
MIPRAILFDLDDTLNDRQTTLKIFVEHFLQEFASKLEPISFDDLLLEYQRVDAGGYRPRDQVHAMPRVERLRCVAQRTNIKTMPMIAATTPAAIAHGTHVGFGRLTPLGSTTMVLVVSSPGSFAFEVMSDPSTGKR